MNRDRLIVVAVALQTMAVALLIAVVLLYASGGNVEQPTTWQEPPVINVTVEPAKDCSTGGAVLRKLCRTGAFPQ